MPAHRRRLRNDGLSLAGRTVQLLQQDQPWETPVIEAPSMVRSGARYYLFYGGNWWESASAAVGYATCRTPLGACSKVTTSGPWFGSQGDAVGPGGASFFTDPAGTLHMAYHAWPPDTVGYAVGGARSLWLDRVSFQDGAPAISP